MGFAEMSLAASARRAVEVSAALKPGEQVCVLADTGNLAIAEALAQASAATGAETVVCIMAPRKMHGNELPPVVAAALRAADVVLAAVTYAFAHTDARLAAARAGTRMVILRGIPEDVFIRGAVAADYLQIDALGKRLAERITAGSSIRMTSPLGSDLTLSIAGRSALCLSGLAHQPGTFTPLPSGEVAIAPVEGTAEGVVVVDHAIDGVGALSEPVRLTIEKGRAVRIEGGSAAQRLRELIDGADAGASNVAEFAVGLNPLSRMKGNMQEDKVQLGCVHVALGDNHTIGGTTSSEIHLDHVVLKPTVWLDGELVVDAGVLRES